MPINVRLIGGNNSRHHRRIFVELGATSGAVIDELLSFQGVLLAISGVPAGMLDEVRSAAARSGVSAIPLSKEGCTSLVMSGQLGAVRELCDAWMPDPILAQLSGPILRAVNRPKPHAQKIGGRHFDFQRPILMGVLNTTPDSFSDGGQTLDLGDAMARAEQMVTDGAEIIDVGGASSRPGAAPVAEAIESKRIMPVIKALVAEGVIVSVDTYRANIAHEALDFGAAMINDITALRGDSKMATVLSRYDVPVILMHMKGAPASMQDDPQYDDVVGEVTDDLIRCSAQAQAAGISRERLWLDPGIGFGKTVAHNLSLLRHLSELTSLGFPTAVGTSRKSFLGALTGRSVGERGYATAATTAWAVLCGVHMLRVHDVAATRDVLTVSNAIADAEFR